MYSLLSLKKLFKAAPNKKWWEKEVVGGGVDFVPRFKTGSYYSCNFEVVHLNYLTHVPFPKSKNNSI